jgi:uncharacterized protein
VSLAALTLAGGAALAVGTFAGATTNRVTGLGFSLVCSPVMLLVLGARDGVRLLNMVSVAVTLTNVVTSWRSARRRDCLLLLAAGVTCTPLAAWAAHRSDERVLLVGAGLITVASAVLLATGRTLRFVRGDGGALGAGAASATMNVVAGLSGPSVAMYGLNAGWTAAEFRPTLQVYFLVLNAVAVASLGPVRPPLALVTAIAVAVVAGLLAGRHLSTRVPVARFRAVVLAIVVLGGLAAVARGLVG